MTRTRSPGNLVAACALVALAASGLGCDLNPQPLPPGGANGSDFAPGTPIVEAPDASAAFDGGGGGLSLGGSGSGGGAVPYRGDAGADATTASPPPAVDASDGGVDSESDAAESGADAPGDVECGSAEGEQ